MAAPEMGQDQPNWKQVVARYERPTVRHSVWQLTNTLVPYAALWCAMAWSVAVSYWITLLLAIPTAGFHVRLFIIFHDCGHNSFFASGRANRVMGRVLGVLVFTPYDHWRHEHALHHATAGDL